MTRREPREKAVEIGDKERGINCHVENARHKRQPRLLKSPEIAECAADPGVIAALVGKGTCEFANHEGSREAPENRGENQDKDAAAVARAMDDVLGSIRASRHHKKRRGDE